MNKKHSIQPAIAIAMLAIGFASATDAALLRSGASYDSSSTTEDNGFRCGSFASGATVSCDGSAFYESAEGSFSEVTYSSSGSASFGNLRTEAFLTYEPDVDDPNADLNPEIVQEPVDVRPLPNFARAFGSASFRDDWLITGAPAGTPGTLSMLYRWDGESSSPTVPGISVTGVSSLRIGEIGTLETDRGTVTTIVQPGTSLSSPFNGTLDEIVRLSLDFVFGELITVQVNMSSSASFDLLDASAPGFRTFSDFFNTASLNGIEVTDSDGLQTPFTLESSAGIEAFEQFSTADSDPTGAIPLPSTLALLLAGCGAIVLRRRVSDACVKE